MSAMGTAGKDGANSQCEIRMRVSCAILAHGTPPERDVYSGSGYKHDAPPEQGIQILVNFGVEVLELSTTSEETFS
jgi:hypothetical protein